MWVLCVLRQPNLLPIYRCDIVIFPHSSALSSPQSLSFSPSLSLSFLLLLCFGLHLASDETGFWAWFTHIHISLICFIRESVSVSVRVCACWQPWREPKSQTNFALLFVVQVQHDCVRHVPPHFLCLSLCALSVCVCVCLSLFVVAGVDNKWLRYKET